MLDIVTPIAAAILTATVAGAWIAFRQAVQRIYADQRKDRAELLSELRDSRKERAQ